MTWRGEFAKAAYRQAAARALDIGAELILTEANKTVPIEEATLERSGAVSVDDQRLEAAVSYDTPYARVQHEDRHLRHDPGRRAKWLQLTLDEKWRDVSEVIAAEIRRRIP